MEVTCSVSGSFADEVLYASMRVSNTHQSYTIGEKVRDVLSANLIHQAKYDYCGRERAPQTQVAAFEADGTCILHT